MMVFYPFGFFLPRDNINNPIPQSGIFNASKRIFQIVQDYNNTKQDHEKAILNSEFKIGAVHAFGTLVAIIINYPLHSQLLLRTLPMKNSSYIRSLKGSITYMGVDFAVKLLIPAWSFFNYWLLGYESLPNILFDSVAGYYLNACNILKYLCLVEEPYLEIAKKVVWHQSILGSYALTMLQSVTYSYIHKTTRDKLTAWFDNQNDEGKRTELGFPDLAFDFIGIQTASFILAPIQLLLTKIIVEIYETQDAFPGILATITNLICRKDFISNLCTSMISNLGYRVVAILCVSEVGWWMLQRK